MIVAGGCASTEVTQRNQVVQGPLPRPAHIYVYDFATTAAEVPPNSALAQEFKVDATAQTPEQVALGRQLGTGIAAQLVAQISEMGMPARHATQTSKPAINDIVIRGYLVSIEAGSQSKRVAIGFGSGSSDLRTVVEAFQVTADGMRKLGSGTLEAASGKSPGGAVGAAVFIATANPAGLIVSSGMKVHGEATGSAQIEGRGKATAEELAAVMKKRFQELGWIKPSP